MYTMKAQRKLIILLGPPQHVNGIEDSYNEVDEMITFSWSPSFSPYDSPVTYHVRVVDVGGSHDMTTNSTLFLYTPGPEDSCSVLTIIIYASNSAGKSNESSASLTLLTSTLSRHS